jgi:DNA-binding transcriptional ArsR family regulator
MSDDPRPGVSLDRRPVLSDPRDMPVTDPSNEEHSGSPVPARQLQVVRDATSASALVHPMRLAMLQHLQEGGRTTGELAEEFGISRQKIGYHVRELASAGLVEILPEDASTGKRHPEKRYVASARRYVLDPAILGPLSPRADDPHDPAGAERFLASTCAAQTEVSRQMVEPDGEPSLSGSSTMSVALDAELPTAEARTRFVQSLVQATRSAADDASSDAAGGAAPPDDDARTYRVLVLCYPRPAAD